MVQGPSVTTATITIPIYTRVKGVEMELGEATIEVPISLTASAPDAEAIGAPDGPHSRACGISPHQHGASCSGDCPTCMAATPDARHSQGVTPVSAEGQVSLPVGQVPAPGDATLPGGNPAGVAVEGR